MFFSEQNERSKIMTTAVSLHGVRKDFGNLTALSDVTLEIEDNEFFTLLGPSG